MDVCNYFKPCAAMEVGCCEDLRVLSAKQDECCCVSEYRPPEWLPSYTDPTTYGLSVQLMSNNTKLIGNNFKLIENLIKRMQTLSNDILALENRIQALEAFIKEGNEKNNEN